MLAHRLRRAAGGAGGNLEYVGGKCHAFAGTTSTTNVSLTDLTGGLDTQPSENDIVVVGYGVGSTSDVDLSITGYTELADLYSDDSRDANLGVYYKVMTSTPDTSLTLSSTGSTANGGCAIVHVWRGVDTATPIDVTTQTATGIDTAIGNAPAITPSTPGAIIIVMGAGAGSVSGGPSNTTGLTQSGELDNYFKGVGADSNGAIMGMGSYSWGGGAFDPAAFTGEDVAGFSDTTNNSWCAATLALRPA